MKPADRTVNRLITEKSPYLLQHAHNPVDWYPWGEEAFDRARTADRPVFLSVGYSTCHWCHVMERESFEDEGVAAILNQRFVPVKVDREERPDVDHIYMTACQAITGHGGWPLTAVLTPAGEPFFAGTYFPRESKWGRPGVIDILTRIADLWDRDRDSLLKTGRRLAGALNRHFAAPRGERELSQDTVDAAYGDLEQLFDDRYGGFGRAPKFPTPHNLTFLLRHHWYRGRERAAEMVDRTLEAMYRGGIHDHIGFGFSRYSTDRKWLVPHFEKMLYDNALLAIAYLEGYQVTGREMYARVDRGIFDYLLRHMRAPGGGFCSAEDADSEGVEGAFYVWTRAQVASVLGRDRGETYCRVYGITDEDNFEGGSIPNLLAGLPETVAPREGLEGAEMERQLELSRLQLLEARERRVRPFRDDKVLTSWNALAIAALAVGSRVLGDPALLDAAGQALDFILDQLRLPDGRLLARFRDGEAAVGGYVDDYAFLSWACTELYRTGLDPAHLSLALELNNLMLDLFWDEGGGLFLTEGKNELIARPRTLHDGAMPSGTSVAAANLALLTHLTGDPGLEGFRDRLVRSSAGEVAANPAGYTFFLQALQLILEPPLEVVVAGNPGEAGTRRLLEAACKEFAPGLVLVLAPDGDARARVEAVVPRIRGMTRVDGRPAAYVCRDFSCQEPVTDPGQLCKQLART